MSIDPLSLSPLIDFWNYLTRGSIELDEEQWAFVNSTLGQLLTFLASPLLRTSSGHVGGNWPPPPVYSIAKITPCRRSTP